MFYICYKYYLVLNHFKHYKLNLKSCAPPPRSRSEPAAGWRPLQCSRRRPRLHASKPPVHHHPAACLSRPPDGGQCSVEVVHASKPPVRHHNFISTKYQQHINISIHTIPNRNYDVHSFNTL